MKTLDFFDRWATKNKLELVFFCCHNCLSPVVLSCLVQNKKSILLNSAQMNDTIHNIFQLFSYP